MAFVSDYWTSVVHLRSQLGVIQTTYPVEIETVPQDVTDDDPDAPASGTSAVAATMPSFKAVVKTVDLAAGSKVMIRFFFDFGVFARWPMALKKTGCEVQVLVGPFKYVSHSVTKGAHPDVHPPARRTSACL